MKTYNIAEINDLDHGIPISRFEGRIKKVFEQKSGEGQYGTWYLQNLIVEDGQQEITVTWTGDDPFGPENEGGIYSFETGYDKKEKPVGIVRDIRSKNGKKYEGVKVDNRSKIHKLGAGDESTKRWDESPPKKNGSAFQQTKAAMQQGENIVHDDLVNEEYAKNAPQSPPAHENGHEGITATRKHLMQSSNLLVLCIRAAEKAVAPHQPVVAQTSEQFQSDVAKLFIEASGRRTTDGVHWWSYVDRMPETPIV